MTSYRTEILIGETIDGEPVTIPRIAVDDKYFSVRGGVGAGKTLTLAYLSAQLIEPYLRDHQPCRDPVGIVDLGADAFYYHMFAKACADNGVRLWTICDDPRRSHHFDPAQTLAALGANPAELANFLSSALNLAFSEEYGKGYWSAVNVNDLIEGFTHLFDRGVTAPSLHDLAEELKAMNRRRRTSNLSQAVYACNLLLQYPQLKATGDPSKDCNIKSVLENCDAVFCSLDAIRQAPAARAIGSLVSRTFLVESDIRKQEGQSPRYPRLIQDEAAQLISKANADAYFLGRKHISLAMSYQSSHQWVSRDGDLRGALRDNCAYKLYFGATTEDDVKELQGYSRETTALLGGTSASGPLRTTTSSREYLTRTLTINEILDITWTRWMAFWVSKMAPATMSQSRSFAAHDTQRNSTTNGEPHLCRYFGLRLPPTSAPGSKRSR